MFRGETERDSWDFTAEAGRLRLAAGSALMKDRVMKEGSRVHREAAVSHAGREPRRRRRPVITVLRACVCVCSSGISNALH